MLVDTSASAKSHEEIANELASIGHEIGVQIKAQKGKVLKLIMKIRLH